MGTHLETAELLFGKYRRQLLALLLLRPEESFYVRELERLSGMRAGSLHRELTALADAGLVRRLPYGNQVRYQANQDNPIYADLANVFRKTAGAPADTAPELREPSTAYRVTARSDRAPSAKGITGLRRLGVSRSAVAAICRKWKVGRMSLFGSVTRDDFRADSDVDVLVEFSKGEEPSLFGLVDLRDQLSSLFGRPVDVVTPSVFRNPIREKAIKRDLQVIHLQTPWRAHRAVRDPSARRGDHGAGKGAPGCLTPPPA